MKSFTRILAALAVAVCSTTALAQYRPPGQMAPAVGGGIQNKPVLRVCTGRQGGNYFFAAQQMARFATSVAIQPVLTQGSLENVQRVTNGSCDVAFAQNDAIRVYKELDPTAISKVERGMAMYKEYVHLLCNRESGITKITHLKKGHVVAIGPEGTGANVVWQFLVATDKDRYKDIQTSPKDGLRGLTAIQDGDEVTCALYVGGLGDQLLKKDAQKFADKVVLVNVNEGVDREKDAKGRPIYSYESIPSGTYGNLMPSGALFGHSSASTFAVDAVFIANTDWIERNSATYDNLLRAVTNSLPAVRERANPK
jgi:TRAP transporter TAXI family solute receptor